MKVFLPTLDPSPSVITINSFQWFGLKIFCAFCQHICMCISYLKNLHKWNHTTNAILHLSFFTCMSNRIFHTSTYRFSAFLNDSSLFFHRVQEIFNQSLIDEHFSCCQFLLLCKMLSCASYTSWWILWVHPIGDIPGHGISGSKSMLVPFKVH